MDLLSSLVSEKPRHLIVSVCCSCVSIEGARVQCGAGFLRSILSVGIAAFNILYLAASSLNSRRNYFPGTRLALIGVVLALRPMLDATKVAKACTNYLKVRYIRGYLLALPDTFFST